MKIKTADLTGAALDWAVATCEGFTEYDPITGKMLPPRKEWGWVYLCDYNWATDWAQGGPIIEREGIRLHHSHTGAWWAGPESDPHRPVSGPTPLIAAMRCFVASKMGDTIDIPEELV
jgi:hypothetical protein